MPERTDVDGIAVWEWPGAPPDTLLMHGLGNYGRYWDFFADAVAGRLHLFAPDARGHGDSPKPAEGYAADDFARDAIAVLDAKRIGRALIVAHSMGAFHATALTLAHMDRVRGLVIIDTGPGIEPAAGDRARRLTLGRPDRFASADDARAYVRETSPGYTDAVYANRLAFLFQPDGDALVWRSSKDALRQTLDTVHQGPVWDRLSEITVPVLVVRGSRSPTFTPARARLTLAPLRHGKLIELDAAHNVPLDQPRALADAVVEFAKGL